MSDEALLLLSFLYDEHKAGKKTLNPKADDMGLSKREVEAAGNELKQCGFLPDFSSTISRESCEPICFFGSLSKEAVEFIKQCDE